MVFMETPTKPLFDGLFDEPKHAPSHQRHRIAWTVEPKEGLKFTLECLHGPVPENTVCDAELMKENPDYFPQWFTGDKVALRDGVIESWWEGGTTWSYEPDYDDAELLWRYAEEEADAETPAA